MEDHCNQDMAQKISPQEAPPTVAEPGVADHALAEQITAQTLPVEASVEEPKHAPVDDPPPPEPEAAEAEAPAAASPEAQPTTAVEERQAPEPIPEAVVPTEPAQLAPVAAEEEQPVPMEQEKEQEAVKEIPADVVITERLNAILKEVDLGVTTEKMLRKKLEGEYEVDLSSKKPLIRQIVEAYLEEQQGNEQEGNDDADVGDEDEEDDVPLSRKRSRGGASRFGDVLSEPMAALLGVDRCPRTQVVKKLWEYIKANDLQDPKDKRKIILDDKLKTIFPGKTINMFSMQKHLSKHVFIAADLHDAESEESDEDDEEERPKKKQQRKPAPKAKAKPKKATGEKKPNGFTKPVRLAPELAEWMGKESASRPEITKHLWAYVKERDLQDPSNKQYVLADETLKKLTGEDRFLAFGFSKLIKDKVLGYAE